MFCLRPFVLPESGGVFDFCSGNSGQQESGRSNVKYDLLLFCYHTKSGCGKNDQKISEEVLIVQPRLNCYERLRKVRKRK